MKTMKYTTADGYTFEGFIVNMGDKLTTELGDVIDLVDEDMEVIDDEMYAVFYYKYNY